MDVAKKKVEVTGRLIYPLVVGMPAYIKEEDGILKTSRVVQVDEVTTAQASFETLNTNYCMRQPADICIRCCSGGKDLRRAPG